MNTVPLSMVNEAMAAVSKTLTPAVGMLATYHIGSDRYAVVVAKVISPKKIFVVDVDDFDLPNKIVDENGIEWLPENIVTELLKSVTPTLDWYRGMAENEAAELLEWDTNRFNKSNTFTLRKNNRWVREGEGLWGCGGIHLGIADPYLDPCF